METKCKKNKKQWYGPVRLERPGFQWLGPVRLRRKAS